MKPTMSLPCLEVSATVHSKDCETIPVQAPEAPTGLDNRLTDRDGVVSPTRRPPSLPPPPEDSWYSLLLETN
jgi:hypothetical protein